MPRVDVTVGPYDVRDGNVSGSVVDDGVTGSLLDVIKVVGDTEGVLAQIDEEAQRNLVRGNNLDLLAGGLVITKLSAGLVDPLAHVTSGGDCLVSNGSELSTVVPLGAVTRCQLALDDGKESVRLARSLLELLADSSNRDGGTILVILNNTCESVDHGLPETSEIHISAELIGGIAQVQLLGNVLRRSLDHGVNLVGGGGEVVNAVSTAVVLKSVLDDIKVLPVLNDGIDGTRGSKRAMEESGVLHAKPASETTGI